MNAVADIRKDYKLQSLSEKDVHPDPLLQFERWWQQALGSDIEEVNAMTLATATADGVPDARIVLLKGFDANGFVFFTNYSSAKGRELNENPKAALVFFWPQLERQIRIMGIVEKINPAESDAYFNSRPEGSRIGAWASPQSQVIQSREWLEQREANMRTQFATGEIKRPPHWGGFRVRPVSIEFWQGRPNRLHDRIQYSLEQDGWRIARLAP